MPTFSTVASSAACISRSVFFDAPPNCWICCELRYSTFSTGSGCRSAGSMLGHLQRRQHGHRRVEADIVLAAERLGIGQGAGGDQLLQVGLAAVRASRPGSAAASRPACSASGRPARRTCRTRATPAPSSAKAVREAQILGQRRAQAGHQHAASDRFQKIATSGGIHERLLQTGRGDRGLCKRFDP